MPTEGIRSERPRTFFLLTGAIASVMTSFFVDEYFLFVLFVC